MVEKLFCILGGLLSILGVFVSSHREELYTSTYYSMQQKDVSFRSVSTQNGTKVHFTRHTIYLDSVNLKKIYSSEVITYEVMNPTMNDVSFEILINGEENFQDEYFDITCSELIVPARSKSTGTITITLKKSVVDDYSLPFEINYKLKDISN